MEPFIHRRHIDAPFLDFFNRAISYKRLDRGPQIRTDGLPADTLRQRLVFEVAEGRGAEMAAVFEGVEGIVQDDECERFIVAALVVVDFDKALARVLVPLVCASEIESREEVFEPERRGCGASGLGADFVLLDGPFVFCVSGHNGLLEVGVPILGFGRAEYWCGCWVDGRLDLWG